ncbi:hypothetical protein X728_17820 [Mesorhizobium sp. L103C120A0]|nr:hypothetical protein X728_17820 [Mesorhizobium sp. L103C120A0]
MDVVMGFATEKFGPQARTIEPAGEFALPA